MDPVSIAASIITLLAAANHVAGGLSKLASLKGAPDAVRAVNNEVSDLRFVLCEAQDILEKHGKGAVRSTTSHTSLQPSMDRAREKLKGLEATVENRLLARMHTKDKIGWMFEQDKLQKALGDIRAARDNVAMMINVVNGSSSFRVEAKLQDVELMTQQGQAELLQALIMQNDSLEKRFVDIIEAQQQIQQRLQNLEVSPQTSHRAPMKPAQKGPAPPPKYRASPPQAGSAGKLFAGDSFSALRMRFLRQTKCQPWCDCRCHTYKRAHAYDGGQSMLGTLFLGYTGIPTITPECSNDRCRRSSESFLQFSYYFPAWFLSRAVSIAVRMQSASIPEFKWRVMNLRGSYEEIFQSAISGDSRSIQYLLESGRASVRDISDDSGHSPLHCAVRDSRIEVIKVLLQWKAEVYIENRKQESPYDMASDNIFYFQGTPHAADWRIDEIRELFPITEWVEERRMFTQVHKIVLGLLAVDLEKALLKDPSGADKPDADGRTPLSWAAARGDSRSVEVLLRYGASPNARDRIGQGPLRQSLKAHNADCLQLLLEKGAAVDQTDDWDQTCLLAAHYYPNPVSFTGPLLQFGARVNVRCSQGRFPLMEAVSKNNVEAVKLLLDRGADVNLANNAGATTLHEAVRHNSHEALGYFLGSDVDHSARDTQDRTVLHYAAEYADLQTLNILQQERLDGLDADDEDSGTLTPIAIAEKRQADEEKRGLKIVNTDWIVAFSDLLESLRPFQSPESVPNSPESVASNEAFPDANQAAGPGQFEVLADLAEEGKIPSSVTTTLVS